MSSNNVSRGSSGDLNNRWDAISQSLFGDNVDESFPSIDQTISEDDESEVFVDATSEDTVSNEAGRSNKDEVDIVPDTGINSNNNSDSNSNSNSNNNNASSNVSNSSDSVANSSNNRTEPNPSLLQRLRRSFLFKSTVD